MKFLSLSALLVPVAFGQTYNDFGCNHFSLYPTDVCLEYSGLGAFKYACSDSNTIAFETYSSYSDCASSNSPSVSVDYDLTGTWGDVAECDNSNTCGYWEIVCDDTTTLLWVVDVCISSGSISAMYECDGSTLTTTSYSNSDCSGGGTSASFDYSSLYTSACYSVK